MERFSNSTGEVGQDGRRGAQMQSISVHHPEVLTFVNIKKDRTKVTGANISIRLTDEFLKAVYSDSKYEQRWPVDSKEPKIKKKFKTKSKNISLETKNKIKKIIKKKILKKRNL